MPRSADTGTHIVLRQSKGNRRVSIKVTDTLRALLDQEYARLDAMPVPSMMILNGKRGRPWTEGGFRKEWQKIAIKAGIHGRLTYHDIRGTCVTRLFEAGNDIARICSITGHSLKACEAILDRYLARTQKLPDQAIDNLVSHRKKG